MEGRTVRNTAVMLAVTVAALLLLLLETAPLAGHEGRAPSLSAESERPACEESVVGSRATERTRVGSRRPGPRPGWTGTTPTCGPTPDRPSGVPDVEPPDARGPAPTAAHARLEVCRC